MISQKEREKRINNYANCSLYRNDNLQIFVPVEWYYKLSRKIILSMLIFLLVIPLVLIPVSSMALGPHPRIWLDNKLLAELSAKIDANDPTWVKFKARLDLEMPLTENAGYQGSDWYEPGVGTALGVSRL